MKRIIKRIVLDKSDLNAGIGQEIWEGMLEDFGLPADTEQITLDVTYIPDSEN